VSIAYSAPDWFFRRVGSRFIDTGYQAVEGYLRVAAGLSDDELRVECGRALDGDELRARFGKPARPSIARRLAHVGRPDRTSLQLRYLALAVESFRHHPADLPAGSQLYPHQVRAAIALTQPSALQMDTGEGKTYAALPAAFALACEFGRVYIICANRYLAWRDAGRTQPFWASMGTSVSYADLEAPTHAWDRRIVYTTIRDLIFYDQRNEIVAERPRHPIVPGAVLLDEIDAILLDGADQPYETVRHLADAPFEWSEANGFAETLVPEEITVDFAGMTANLTVDGEARLREEWAIPAAATHRYLLARYAVELSYVAVGVAERDRDYVVKDDRVVDVDRRTGHLNAGSRPPWVLPLESMLHLQRGFRSVTLTRSDPKRVLRRFQHVAGMSGSAAEDFLHYLFQYFLIPITIPPRRPRQNGMRPDQTFRTRVEAHQAVVAHIVEAAAARRPVLVGTQTIEDAEAIFALLSAAPPAGASISLLTGKNEQAIAAVLEHAGQVGSIVVATQVVGRGVDIRLSDEARANGGLALIAAGHAVELRHDRQFLGRAGRQGDPYTAMFVSSLEDELMTRFGSARIQHVMQRLGMDGEPIESPMIDKAVGRAQRQIRLHAFIARQAASMHARTLTTAHEGVRAWFESLQSESDAYPEDCGPEMIDWLASDYIDTRLVPICGKATHVGTPEAERVIETVCADLGIDRRQLPLGPLDVEGHATSVVRERLLAGLRTMVREAAVANRAVREAARRAPSVRGLIHELLSLRDGFALELAGRPAARSPVAAGTAPTSTPAVENRAEGIVPLVAAELGPAGTRRVVQTIEQMARRLHEEANTRRGWTAARAVNRTPRMVAAESLIAVWSQFLGDCDSHRFRVLQAGLTPLAFYHRLDQEIDREWRRVRDLVAPKVLANLIAGARPESLDDLFFTLEHQQAGEVSADERFRPPDTVDAAPASTPESPHRAAVLEFLAVSPVAASTTAATVAEFRRAVLDFSERTPASQLQTPRRILEAMANWSRLEVERGLPADRRRVHMQWIRAYLTFLRRRNLIAPLPTIAQRTRWRVDLAVQSAMTEASLVTLAGLVLFLSLFMAATVFGRIPGLHLEGASVAFDYLLCAGLLQFGTVTSAAFPGLLAGRGLLLLVTPKAIRAPRGMLLERLAVLVVQVGLAFWITPWPEAGAGGAEVLRAAGIMGTCLLVAITTNSLTWLIDQKAGVAMDGLFLATGIAVVGTPWLAAVSPAPEAALGLFAGAAVVAACGPLLNRVSLQLASARIAVSGSAVRSEEVLTTSSISGSIGFPPYLFALLMAVSLGAVARGQAWESVALYAVYAATLAGITIRVIAARTSVADWSANLNATRRVIVGVDEAGGLGAFLGRLRWILLLRALALHAVLIGACLAVLGWDARLATLPATPLVLLAAFLLVDAARPSVVSVARLVLGIGRHQEADVDIEDVTAPDEELTLWERLKKLKGGRLYTALACVVFVMQIVPLLLEPFTQKSVLELLKLLKDVLK
jgi:hypothetical protein